MDPEDTTESSSNRYLITIFCTKTSSALTSQLSLFDLEDTVISLTSSSTYNKFKIQSSYIDEVGTPIL